MHIKMFKFVIHPSKHSESILIRLEQSTVIFIFFILY